MSQAVADAEGWWIQAKGSAYGPYSLAQVRQYIGEGRVKAGTLVSQSRNGEWRAVSQTAELSGSFHTTQPAAAAKAAPELANLFVFAEIHSGAWTQFMAAIEAIGRVAELAPGFWLVRTKLSSGVVRNTLSQTLETGDKFVVVDATRDRLAWYNMGPGIDVSIREVWNARG